MFHFHRKYFFLALLLLLTEVFIALYVHDKFVRPYAGDFLVVILLYCIFKAFLDISVVPVALLVLVIAYAIEMLQYFKLLYRLGLQHSKLARVILGTSFAWTDMLAYTLGIILVIIIEKLRTPKYA